MDGAVLGAASATEIMPDRSKVRKLPEYPENGLTILFSIVVGEFHIPTEEEGKEPSVTHGR